MTNWDKDRWLRSIYPPDGIKPPVEEKPKRVRGPGKSNLKPLVDAAKQSGLVPLSDEHFAHLNARLDLLTIGGWVKIIYANDESHRTVEGDYVGHDENVALVMSHTKGGDRFNKIPKRMMLWVTYKDADHGTIE